MRTWEPTVKTLSSQLRYFRTPLSAEFLNHCMLSTIQRRALPRYQSEEIEIFNIQFSQVEIEPITPRRSQIFISAQFNYISTQLQ